MKAWWLVMALVGIATAAPRPMPPAIERNCATAVSWDPMQQCIDRFEPGAVIKPLATGVKQIATKAGRQYVFIQVGEAWQLAAQLGDASYELVQRSDLTVTARPAVQVDLSHHVALGNTGVLIERVAIICSDAVGRCRMMVTACTVIQHGRAVETFRGTVKNDADGLTLVGDRTHSGQYCTGR